MLPARRAGHVELLGHSHEKPQREEIDVHAVSSRVTNQINIRGLENLQGEQCMSGFVRRVVTGHDASGRAVVLSDAPAPVVKTNPARSGYRGTDLWKTSATPAPITCEEPDPTLGPRTLPPPRNGTIIRITELGPETDALRNLNGETVHSIFATAGAEHASTFKPGARHPLMHRTETIDYAVVLEGEITLVLDDQDVELTAGDVVIQRGTNHSWSNRSGKMCRMLYVLIDGDFDPELEKLFDQEAQ